MRKNIAADRPLAMPIAMPSANPQKQILQAYRQDPQGDRI
jgi:hypothetical protein